MKNLVLIAVDTLRPDRLGCYGHARPTSPVLDRLAARGAVLESLWSASNFTAPAFTSLFTGLSPHVHGVFDFHTRAPRSTVFERLERAGYETGGVVTFRFFEHLLQRIWGPLEAVTDTRSHDYAKDLPLAVSAGAVDWLAARRGGRPFALFLHYDGPHMPYRLPEEYAHRFAAVADDDVPEDVRRVLHPREHEVLADGESEVFSLLESVNWGRRRLDAATLDWLRDRYDDSVRYNDEAIGRVLDHLADTGLLDETVVCVISDHGEAFLEHGAIGHGGMDLHEEVIRTVGIVAGGGVAAGRIATPCGHVELLPALLELVGAVETGRGGSRLAALLRGETAGDAAELPVFCHGKFKIAVRRGDLKYVRPLPSPVLSRYRRFRLWVKMLLNRRLRAECYDLARDPGERENLAGHRGPCAPLAALVREHLRAAAAGVPGPEAADETERKRIEKEMKDLGYM